MFSAVASGLRNYLIEKLGDQVKMVTYGTPEMIPVACQPCILLATDAAQHIPAGCTQIPIILTVKLYAMTTQLSDNYSAVCAAQDLWWHYTDDSDHEGIMPALIETAGGVMFTDRAGLDWMLHSVGDTTFRGLEQGKNYTGLITMDIKLVTYIKR